MHLLELKEGVAPIRDRMTTTLFLAALLHGILLMGISFGVGVIASDSVPTLEVLLVGNNNLPESRSNPDADYLAERSQQGAGNTLEHKRPVSPKSSLAPIENEGIPQGQALVSREAGVQQGGPEVLASAASAAQTPRSLDTSRSDDGPPQTALKIEAGPVSPMPTNDDGEELVLRGRTERELVVTPNTRESAVAVYLDRWKRKVERIGTMNFPLEARRQNLSGSPVLEVAIHSNGVLEDILVRRSSGHAELDQAALTILKLSTPFDPFPRDLARRHDSLRFAYEWQFLAGNLVDSSVHVVPE